MKNKILSILIAFFLMCLSAYAQEVQNVSGKIMNTLRQPISGVLIQNLNAADSKTVTDKNGDFEIIASAGDVLYIETADASKKWVEVLSPTQNIEVVMNLATQGIDLGFGIEQTMAQSTGAISTTYADDIDTRSALNLQSSLFGNVLGLTALQHADVAWGTQASFNIRGLQTLNNTIIINNNIINNSNDILIVVDGLERSLDQINVEDVESVSVLRDAAAVALYGYKGVNGVLSVKTKRGKYESREIKFTYDHGVAKQTRKPEFLDSYNYAMSINEALNNDGLASRYSPNDLKAFKSGEYPYLFPNVNWFDEVFRNHASSNIYNLSFRGGGTSMRYYTSLNMETDAGFMKEPAQKLDYPTQMNYSKASLRSNLDIDLAKGTLLTVNVQGVLSEFRRPGLGSDDLIGQLYTVPSAAYPVKTYDGVWGGSSTWGTNTNPVALAQARGYSKGHNRSLYADAKLTQNLSFLTKGLSASVRLGYDNLAAYWEGSTRGYAWASDAVNMSSGVPRDTIRTSGGTLSKADFSRSLDYEDRHYNLITSVDYNARFGKHAVLASAMYTYDKHVRKNRYNTYHRIKYSLFTHYGFLDKYFADVILNVSGANHLAPGHKYEFSPTLGLAWVASQEEFLKNVNFIDFLKLRGSVGRIYTDQIPKDNYWSLEFVGGNGYYFGDNYTGKGGTMEGELPVNNIKNERALKMNAGIDASLFNNAITLSADVFYEKRDNIFVWAANGYSAVIGNYPSYSNAGEVTSKGIELGLNHTKQYGDFIINAGGKFTFNRSKIVELLEDELPYDYLRRTGKPVGQMFGYEALGFFIDEADIANSPKQTFSDVKPGDVKYRDRNNDGIIDSYDQVAMGYNAQVPEIYYSFDLGAEWKGLGFSATFQGVGNYSEILNTRSVYRPLMGNTNISTHYYDNRWTPMTAAAAKYPRLTTQNNDNNAVASTIWLVDASFLKLRNCEVYYKLPSSFLEKLRLTRAKVYVRGVDLLTISKLDIVDPESVGIAYPLTKSIHAGVSLSF